MRHAKERIEDRIVVDERIMVGKPVIKGTRITVEAIMKRMADGLTARETLREYPNVTKKDIIAALAYAAKQIYAWKSAIS